MALVLTDVSAGALDSARVTPTFFNLGVEIRLTSDTNAGGRFNFFPIISLASAAALGATSLSLASPLTRTVKAGERLRFWDGTDDGLAVVVASDALLGATTISVVALSAGLVVGSKCFLNEPYVWVTASASGGATSLSVSPLPCSLPDNQGITFWNGVRVILNGAHAKGATTLTVDAISGAVPSATRAFVTNIQFKKAADSEWRFAMPFWRTASTYNGIDRRALYASCCMLEPDTSYHLRGAMDDGDEAEQVWTATKSTRALPADVATFTATHYIRTDGSDSNTGTANNAGGAWKTLEKAITHMNANAGTYRVQFGIGRFVAAKTALTRADVWFKGTNIPLSFDATTGWSEHATPANWTVIVGGKADGTEAVFGTSAGWVLENQGAANDRPVYKLATGINDVRHAQWTTALDNSLTPKKSAHWLRTSNATNSAATLDQWADLMYTKGNSGASVRTNSAYRHGHWSDGAGNVYIRMHPGAGQSDNPNDYAWYMSGESETANAYGFGLATNAATTRITGLVFRCLDMGVQVQSAATDAVVESCIFQGGQKGIATLGSAPTGSGHYFWRCLFEDKGLFSTDQTNDPTTPWWFIKSSGSQGGGYGLQNQAVSITGEHMHQQMTVRQCSMRGRFDLFSGSSTETETQTGVERYVGSNCDFIDNRVQDSVDDVCDGGDFTINFRVYGNEAYRTLTGGSTVGVRAGPHYYAYNTIKACSTEGHAPDALGDPMDSSSCYFMKQGDTLHTGIPPGMVWYLHNTARISDLAPGGKGFAEANGSNAASIVRTRAFNSVGRSNGKVLDMVRHVEQWLAGHCDFSTTSTNSSNTANFSFLTPDDTAFVTADEMARVGAFGGVTKPGFYQALGSEQVNVRNGVQAGFADEIADSVWVSVVGRDFTPAAGGPLAAAGVPLPNWSDIPYPGTGTFERWMFSALPNIGAVSAVGAGEDPDPSAPAKPSNIDLDANSTTEIDFDIDAVSGADGYVFWISTTGVGDPTTNAAGWTQAGTETGDEAEPDLTISGLTPGATYYGIAAAWADTADGPLFGPYSDVASITMPTGAESATRTVMPRAVLPRAVLARAVR